MYGKKDTYVSAINGIKLCCPKCENTIFIPSLYETMAECSSCCKIVEVEKEKTPLYQLTLDKGVLKIKRSSLEQLRSLEHSGVNEKFVGLVVIVSTEDINILKKYIDIPLELTTPFEFHDFIYDIESKENIKIIKTC